MNKIHVIAALSVIIAGTMTSIPTADALCLESDPDCCPDNADPKCGLVVGIRDAIIADTTYWQDKLTWEGTIVDKKIPGWIDPSCWDDGCVDPECPDCPPGFGPWWKDQLILTAHTDYKVEQLVDKIQVQGAQIVNLQKDIDSMKGAVITEGRTVGGLTSDGVTTDWVVAGLVGVAIVIGIANLARYKAPKAI